MRASLRNDERRIRRMKEMKNKRSFPKERNKKNAILVLTTYHKTMWTTKYSCTFVYEDDDDDAEIGEEVIYVFKY